MECKEECICTAGFSEIAAHQHRPLALPCREWLWQVSPAGGAHAEASSSEGSRLQPAGPDSPPRNSGATRPAAQLAAAPQRMYVKALAAEVRLATALSCERG